MATKVSLRDGNWSDGTTAGPWGDSGTANAAVSSTTGPPGTLTDTRKAWATNSLTGATITCNGKTITVASNTGTVITGTAGWSGGGNPGNGNSYTVTWAANAAIGASDAVTINNNVTIDDSASATIDFGPDGASGTIAIEVANGGTLRLGASTGNTNQPTVDHIFRPRGEIQIDVGGSWIAGSDLTGGALVSTRKFIIEQEASAAQARGKWALTVNGTLRMYGAQRDTLHGRTLLSADAAATATTLTPVDNVSAWASGDQIVIDPTERSVSQTEVRAISGSPSTTITVAALTNKHTGGASDPQRAFILNCEKNIIFRTYNGSTDVTVRSGFGWYAIQGTGGVIDMKWCRFQDLAYGASNAQAFTFQSTVAGGGSANFNDCIFVNSEKRLFSTSGAAVANVNLRTCSAYHIGIANGGAAQDSVAFWGATTDTTGFVMSDFWCASDQQATTQRGIWLFNNKKVNISGLRISGLGWGLRLDINAANNNPPAAGFWDNIDCHCNGSGVELPTSNGLGNMAITGWHLWNNTAEGIISGSGALAYISNVTFSDLQLLGNSSGQASLVVFDNCLFLSPVSGASRDFTQPDGFGNSAGFINCTAINATLNGATADIVNGIPIWLDLINPTGSGAGGTVSTSGIVGDFNAHRVRMQRDGATTHYHTYFNNGDVKEEATITYPTASTGLAWRMTPTTRANGARLVTDRLRKVVTAGIAVTVSIYVYVSTVASDGVAYNGAAPTLRVYGGVLQGIPSDVTVNATIPGDGNFHQITTASMTPTENGVLEFAVECDGTTGFIVIDQAS